MEKIKIEQHGATGLLWIAGWLFTLGYLQLGLTQGILAIALWPLYLGRAFAGI